MPIQARSVASPKKQVERALSMIRFPIPNTGRVVDYRVRRSAVRIRLWYRRASISRRGKALTPICYPLTNKKLLCMVDVPIRGGSQMKPFQRRDFLKASAAAALAGSSTLAPLGRAFGAEPINFFAWSAGVDQVKAHVSAFEAKTGIKVNYGNAPWAQYRDTLVTKFVGKAPLDVLWVSDAWLPEWAEAGWLAPIDGYPQLLKYNSDVDDFSTKSMMWRGKQYGLTYYTDYMGFFYDEGLLQKAGISAPP